MNQLRTAIVAIAFFFLTAFPAFAQDAINKAAMVNVISQESHSALKLKDAARIVDAVIAEAKKHSLDPLLMFSIIKKESRYNPRARSREGAIGLTQVIPRWHRDKIRGRNLTHIETNIEVGTQVFADCLEKYNGFIKKAFKCYSSNARNYGRDVRANYDALKKAELKYRFENELPLAEKELQFDVPLQISTSLNAEQVLALQ